MPEYVTRMHHYNQLSINPDLDGFNHVNCSPVNV